MGKGLQSCLLCWGGWTGQETEFGRITFKCLLINENVYVCCPIHNTAVHCLLRIAVSCQRQQMNPHPCRQQMSTFEVPPPPPLDVLTPSLTLNLKPPNVKFILLQKPDWISIIKVCQLCKLNYEFNWTLAYLCKIPALERKGEETLYWCNFQP